MLRTMNEETIDTYNRFANEYVAKFRGIGSHRLVIEGIFRRIQKKCPVALELGCGDGRDASEILKHTKKYTGIDASSELLDRARVNNLSACFICADMEVYPIERPLDVVFAFASFLHVEKTKLTEILGKIFDALEEGGVCHFLVKKGKYREEVITDQFGNRLFYFYDEQDIRDISEQYSCVEISGTTLKETEWLSATLVK